MNRWKVISIHVLAGLALSGAMALWLQLGYARELEFHSDLLIVRGNAVLSALEGGMRSHRRMGDWFRENIDSVFEETVDTPGILGLAFFDKDRRVVSAAGLVPAETPCSNKPQWLPEGLWICRKTVMTAPEESPGNGPRGWRLREEQVEGDANETICLAALLDASEYHEAVSKASWHFYFSVSLSVIVIVFGLILAGLVQRQANLAAQLALARERQQRLEELTHLGAGLAHETKNPINLIRGLAQSWLNKAENDEGASSRARQIIDESDRLVGRVNSFLAYARPKEPDFKAVDIGEILRKTSSLFQDEAESQGVVLSCADKSAQVEADPDMLKQIIANLVSNSLAVCQKGHRIDVEIQRPAAGVIAFAVKDTGPGISREDLPKVRQPYFSRRPGGTGLGLAIVEQIADAHGWRLSIESDEGKGATVRIGNIREAAAK
jgi:signal transduction histidine kinase